MKTSILLIYTGGTIGMKTNAETGALSPFDFNDIYDEFPYLKILDVDIEVLTFKPIDSSNVTPELWIKLARLIQDNYDRFDGFVILHGTDTMAYTASALSFMIENLSKPVVFTGSQIPIGVLRTDGRENLITAVEIAAAKSAGKAIVPEVCIYFQNKLLRATRTIKYSSEELDAFRSDNYPALAEVGVTIQYNRPFIQSAGSGRIKIHTDLNCNVAVIRLFPGLQPELLQTILGNTILKGVVLETYGSGNAPTESWFIDVLEETIRRNVVILNVSQCPHASVKMELYETGKRMQEIGVISGHDMTTESGITKLMWLLGQNLPFSRLKELLGTSVRGEITI